MCSFLPVADPEAGRGPRNMKSMQPPSAAIFFTAHKRSLWKGNIFTSVCHSVHRRVCVVTRGCAWLMGDVHGCWGHAWLTGGMCGCWGVRGCQGASVRSMSRRYTSYWNAFLLSLLFTGPLGPWPPRPPPPWIRYCLHICIYI